MRLCLGVDKSLASKGWYSVDLANGADIKADVTKMEGINFSNIIPNNSCEIIVASHVLEHLNYTGWAIQRVGKAINVLSAWRKKLVDGGKLYVAVPDLDEIVQAFIKYPDSYWRLEDTKYIEILGLVYGAGRGPLNHHSMLFNESCLRYCMESAGFTDVRRFTDSEAQELLPGYNHAMVDRCSLNMVGTNGKHGE